MVQRPASVATLMQIDEFGLEFSAGVVIIDLMWR